MFIKYGDRRINLDSVQEYRPQDQNNYTILIKYTNGPAEILYFFESKEDRDNLINELDRTCLKKLNSGT